MFLRKKGKILLIFFFLVLIVGIFAVAKPAKADLLGVLDLAGLALDALDFADRVVVLLLKFTFIGYISTGFVLLSAHLLEWAMTLPVLLHNPVVLGGFNFVLGFVNLFFVLSLVAIAFAYILKIESLQLKKALPRLIVIMILVNFSLLVVGIFIDIAQFFMNEILRAFGTDFVTIALTPLRQSMGSLMAITVTSIATYMISAFIPFGGAIALTILVAGLLGGVLIEHLFAMSIMIVFNVVLGVIFFTYFILFMTRIAALWLLGIFAPIAFFCYIFTQTKNYFQDWLKAVIQWAFLGVIPLFLLSLITSLFSVFFHRPGEIVLSAGGGLTPLQLPNSIYNYLFLIIFLVITLHVSLKYVPVGAQQVIGLVKGQFKAIGGVAGIMKGGRKIARKTARGLGRALPGTKQKAEKWSQLKMKDKKGLLGVSTKASMGIYRQRAKLGAAFMEATTETDRRNLSRLTKESSEMSKPTWVNTWGQTQDPSEKAGMLNGAIDQNIHHDLYKEGHITEGEIMQSYRESINLGDKKSWENIENGFPELADNFYEWQKEGKKNKDGKRTGEGKIVKDDKDLEEKYEGSYHNKIAKQIKDEADIKKAKGSLKDGIAASEKARDPRRGPLSPKEESAKAFFDAFENEAGSQQLKGIGKVIGRSAVNEINIRNKESGKNAEWYVGHRKVDVMRFKASNAAQDAGYNPVPGAEKREQINKAVKDFKPLDEKTISGSQTKIEDFGKKTNERPETFGQKRKREKEAQRKGETNTRPETFGQKRKREKEEK